MSEKLPPPTHLEPHYLFEKYSPLRMGVFKKFRDQMRSQADREDLLSTIDMLFLQLVNEYNPHRGVDFPYYIKFMLEKRVYHHVTKYHKATNNETFDEEFVIEDDSYDELFQRIVDLNSIDPNIQLGEKHRKLLIGVLIEKKSLKELAAEEGVPPDRLHARLYFLIKKFKKVYEQHRELYGDDLY